MSPNYKSTQSIIRQTALSITLVLIAAGCATPPTTHTARPLHMPSYRELAARHDKNLARINRLWARAVVELHWKDEKGKHFEQGDGNFMVILPDHVVLSIGKLGNTMMWAGCDSTRYWLFDLRDESRVYVGSHAAADHRNPLNLPIQVRPLDLVQLTGLMPITPPPPGAAPKVDWDDGCYLIEPPGQHRRLWLDPQTGRPARIELLTAAGQSRIECRLSRWERMAIDGIAPGGFPWVATRMEINMIGEDATITLFLSEPTDGQANNRIKAKAFSLDHLTKVFKPQRYVDLDTQDQADPSH